MAIHVALSRLGGVADLESTTGTVVTESGQSRLNGAFVLLVAGHRSNELQFDAQTLRADVRFESGKWMLGQMARRSFSFAKPVSFESASGPRFFCSAGWLRQAAPVSSMAQLSLDDARMTLVPNGSDPGAGVVEVRTALGDISVGINPLVHPDDPNRTGSFVLPHDRGFVVCLGAPDQELALGTSPEADVLVGRDCRISFVLPEALAPTSTSALIESSSGSTTAARTSEPSKLLMAASATSSLRRLRLSAEQIEATNGALRVTRFAEKNIWLAQGAKTSDSLSGVTALYTATSRLSFEIDLASAGKAKMRYSDPSIRAPLVQPTASSRYYGLRIAGMASKTGVRPALDANELEFELSGSKIFEAKAGFTQNSLLVPKQNFHDLLADRRLEIPLSNNLSLRVDSPAVPGLTAMTLDTSLGARQLRVHKPHLVSAPAGVTAGGAKSEGVRYGEWLLSADEGHVDFAFSNGLLVPANGASWLQRFHTVNPATKYALIEHPGLALTIDGPATLRPMVAGVASNRTEVYSVTDPTGNETVVYAAFFVALSWAATKFFQHGSEYFLDETRFKLAFGELKNAAFQEFLIRNGLQDLAVVYRAGTANGRQKIRTFIRETMAEQNAPTSEKFLWSLAVGLQMVLYDPKAAGPYCDEIALARGEKDTCFGFDHSSNASFVPADLGYSALDWKTLAKDAPALWPRASGRDGARLDPSEPSWRGVFLRDIPLCFPKPTVVDEFPFLAKLIDRLNSKLVLDYGWRDESGPTWSAGLKQTFAEGLFTPDNWKDTLEMAVVAVRLQGAAGAVVSAEGSVELRLNCVKDKAQKPLQLTGTFGVDLESGKNPITRIDVAQSGAPISTDGLPGFESVALKRVATDFKTAQFELLLVAKQGLADVLPFLSTTEPQRAMLSFDLTGEPSGVISLALPNEIQTRLFGRWPIAVQAMSLSLGGQEPEMRIRVRFHLGMAGFASVGATVTVGRTKDGAGNFGLKLGIALDELEGSLSFGNMTLRGSIKWSEKKPDGSLDSSEIDLAQAPGAGKNRDLWGSLFLEDSGAIGDGATGLAVRVGNRGELSFWIAALEVATSLPIGIGRLKNPALLLAHNADYQGNLDKVVADPTGSVLAAVRPDRSIPINEWLARWQPSSTIGSLIAGSGYVELQPMVAEAPVDGDEVVPEKLSSLLFTDRGLARVDGYVTMLGAVPLRFGLAIDYPNRRITAGLQAPEIKIPPDNPKYVISPGYITIGMSFFGGPPWFRVGIGWPERIGGTEYERDWSKSIKVHIPEMYPINTFWGGYLAELDPANSRVVFGYAIRAGYTNNFEVLGGLGTAELGITLGGVLQFAITWGGPSPSPAAARFKVSPFDGTNPDEFAFAVEALRVFDVSVSNLTRSLDLQLTGEIYGDIWGKASVKFMGVTLAAISVVAFARFRVCGSLKKGITQAKARVGFEVSVRILCVTYSTQASIDITLIEGDCPLLLSPSSMGWVDEPLVAVTPISANS